MAVIAGCCASNGHSQDMKVKMWMAGVVKAFVELGSNAGEWGMMALMRMSDGCVEVQEELSKGMPKFHEEVVVSIMKDHADNMGLVGLTIGTIRRLAQYDKNQIAELYLYTLVTIVESNL